MRVVIYSARKEGLQKLLEGTQIDAEDYCLLENVKPFGKRTIRKVCRA